MIPEKKHVWFIPLLALALLQACAAGPRLTTASAEPAAPKGTYTLLLYGCHYPEDIKNIAILVDEESGYPFEIYDIPTSYRVKGGMPGPQALREADTFARCSTRRVSETQVRRIIGPAGRTIGYEVRPLYFPLEFGQIDVMRVSYVLENGIVQTYITLDPDVERELESSGPDQEAFSPD